MMDANTARYLLDSLVISIDEKDASGFRSVLDRLKTVFVSKKMRDLIVRLLVVKILSCEKIPMDIFQNLLNVLDEHFASKLNKDLAYTYLFGLEELDYKKLALLFPEIGVQDHFDNLIVFTGDIDVVETLSNVDKCYGEGDYKSYSKLRDNSLKAKNMKVVNYFEYRMKAKAPVAEKPSWIIMKKKEGQDKKEPNELKMKPIDWDIKRIDRIENLTQKRIIAVSFPSQREECIKLIKDNEVFIPISEPQEEEIKLFQFTGPLNPKIDSEGKIFSFDDPEHRCQKFGGCRMFLCNCHDNVDKGEDQEDENNEESKDWFTGNCQFCQAQILGPWASIRIPMPNGGWQGIFCSVKCITDYLLNDDAFGKSEKKCIEIILNLIVGQLNKYQTRVARFVEIGKDKPKPKAEPKAKEDDGSGSLPMEKVNK